MILQFSPQSLILRHIRKIVFAKYSLHVQPTPTTKDLRLCLRQFVVYAMEVLLELVYVVLLSRLTDVNEEILDLYAINDIVTKIFPRAYIHPSVYLT